MNQPRRLAIVVSHPIQHFVPFYRALAADTRLEPHVLFGGPIGIKPYYDEEMRSEIKWNMDLLGGYSHEFLDERATSQPHFFSMNSPHVAKRLSAFAPDAVITYGYAQINALRALSWAGRTRVPAMIIGDSERLRERSGLRTTLKSALVPRILARYSAYLGVGDHNEAYYRHYGARPDRIFRVPFTIDEQPFRHAAERRAELRAQLRGELGIASDRRVILFVGKLSPRKRPADIIEALARHRDTGTENVTALYAGNGESAASINALAVERGVDVRLLGFINVDKLPAVYAAADLLVHPSEADPHPLVCSEAACIGLPMILSDRVGAAGPTDIARIGVNALDYRCGDATALARRLGELLGDPHKLDAMSDASRNVFDQLDVQRSIAGVHQALETILG